MYALGHQRKKTRAWTAKKSCAVGGARITRRRPRGQEEDTTHEQGTDNLARGGRVGTALRDFWDFGERLRAISPRPRKVRGP